MIALFRGKHHLFSITALTRMKRKKFFASSFQMSAPGSGAFTTIKNHWKWGSLCKNRYHDPLERFAVFFCWPKIYSNKIWKKWRQDRVHQTLKKQTRMQISNKISFERQVYRNLIKLECPLGSETITLRSWLSCSFSSSECLTNDFQGGDLLPTDSFARKLTWFLLRLTVLISPSKVRSSDLALITGLPIWRDREMLIFRLK